MTAYAITRNPHPMRTLPLLGKDAEFARFLELRKKRRQQAEKDSRHG